MKTAVILAIALAFLVAFMEAIAQAEVLSVSYRMMGFSVLKLAYAYRTLDLILGGNCSLCWRCKVSQETSISDIFICLGCCL